MNVLEHIEDDKEELNIAVSKLNQGGHLIILVPAHNELYSKFDKEIGHFRRYKVDFFNQLNIDNCLLYTSPSPRDREKSRMPSSA